MQGSINFDGSLVGNITGGGGGGGDTVVINPVVTSGTKIADVSVNGVEKDLYCPTPPTPPQIDITPVQESGTKIADVSLNGVEKDLYAPNPTQVNITPVQQSGTKIATIGVNGVDTDIYAPSGCGGGDEYSQTPHKVGKYVENNVEYDVWEVMLVYGAQYYGEEEHNLSYLNIYKLLDVRGSIKMNSDGGNWGYYSPFYFSNSLFDNYRWDDTNKILITLQAGDMYGKVDSRMITIRYLENVN